MPEPIGKLLMKVDGISSHLRPVDGVERIGSTVSLRSECISIDIQNLLRVDDFVLAMKTGKHLVVTIEWQGERPQPPPEQPGLEFHRYAKPRPGFADDADDD